MSKIYQEQQLSNYAHTVDTAPIRAVNKSVSETGNQLSQMAQSYEKQAKAIYSKALEINTNETMGQLYEQYKDNPVELNKAFDSAYSKINSEIVDDDVKVDFTANMMLKRQVYLTKAKENKKKSDYRIMKSVLYDGIDDNTRTIGEAFSTLLGDEFNPDNLAVYGSAVAQNQQMINTLNEDGTFMFTDEQRKAKVNDMEKIHLFAMKRNFSELEGYKKNEYVKLLEEDNILIPVGVGENDETKQPQVVFQNLKDLVSFETYEKFKDYALRVSKKKSSVSKSGGVADDGTAWEIAEKQTANDILVESEIKSIKSIKGENAKENVDKVLRILELQDSINGMGETGLSASDYKRHRKETISELLEALKVEGSDDFDDAVFDESSMSIGLQALKTYGKVAGDSWGDGMSAVMIRDFYKMAKENGVDLRATDSGSREHAKKIASKAISNTIERVVGGYGKEFNSVFLNGTKVSKDRIKDPVLWQSSEYTIDNNKKKYTETGIEVEL